MLPGRVKISSTEIRPIEEALIFLETVEFLFTYVKFEVEKGHLIVTGIWKYRTTVLHRTQEYFQES